MKRLQKIMIVGLLAGPMIFFGCQKSDVVEPVQTPADEITDNINIDNKEYCGETVTYALSEYWTNTDFGTVTIGNDESNLIINYDMDETNGYTVRVVHIYVINDGLTPPFNIADEWNADGSGHFFAWSFPFITGSLNTLHHQEIISFADLANEGVDVTQCLNIVAIAQINNPVTGDWQWAFAKPSLKYWGWYVDFCPAPCDEPTCETAYAFGGDVNDCFLNLNCQGNNWGWSNGGITEGYYEWEIYAGAGQCDISKGTLVGMLIVDYSGGYARITYDIDPAFTLDETHLHIGFSEATRLPLNKKNQFITAPGQFQYSGGDYFEIPATGTIWVTAHSVVCGYYE